jgi:hypothetical protein
LLILLESDLYPIYIATKRAIPIDDPLREEDIDFAIYWPSVSLE